MRLFVAADLSVEQRKELRVLVEEAKRFAPFDYIRWIPEENWHATLAFIGDREDSQIPAIEADADQLLSIPLLLKADPIRIQAFPDRMNPRLLAFKLNPGTMLQKLYWNLGHSLRLKDHQRNFRLHITIARFRDLDEEGTKTLNEAIRDLSQADPVTWQFPTVTLYESKLRQSGAEYRVIRTWGMQAAI